MRLSLQGITLVVSGMPPMTMRMTSRSKYLGTSSAMRPLVAGDSSDGLSTTQLPAAMAPIWSSMNARKEESQKNEMAYDGAEGQPDWIVEWADGENDALGLFPNDGTKGSKVDVERGPFWTSPLVDAVIGDFAVADGRVEFEAASVEVRVIKGIVYRERTRTPRETDDRGLLQLPF